MQVDVQWLNKAKRASKRNSQQSEEETSLISKKSGIPFRQEAEKKAREMNQLHGTATIPYDGGKSIDEKAYVGMEGLADESEEGSVGKERAQKGGGKEETTGKPDASAKKDASSDAVDGDMFTEKWWKKVRPSVFFTDPGLDKKLREYELAAELAVNHSEPADYNDDYDAMLSALEGIDAMAARALQICQKSPIILKKTIDLLEKYPAEIDNKKKAVEQSRQKRAKLQAQAVDDGAGDGKLAVYYKCDISQGARESPPLDNYSWLKFSDCVIELEISEDILNQLKKGEGHATLDAMVLDAKEACDAVIRKIAKEAVRLMWQYHCQQADEMGRPILGPAAKPNATEMVLKELRAYVAAEVKALTDKVDGIPKARWENWTKQKTEYKKYKLKTGKNIGLGVLGLVGSAVTMGLAVPTGGAALAMGIVGLVKSTTHVLDLSVQLWKEAEHIQEELEKDLGHLKKAYLDEQGKAKETVGGVKTMGLQEMGKAVVKEATLGLSELAGHLAGLLGKNPGWNASLNSCKSDYKNLQGKVAHLVVNNQEFAAAAVAVLDAIGLLEQELETKKDEPEKAGKVLVKIKKLREMVDADLQLAHSLGGRIRAMEKVLPDLEKSLNALDGENPAYAEIFATLLPAVADVLVAAGSAAAGFAAATHALEFIATATTLCQDLTEMLAQCGGTWVGLGKRYMGK